MLLCHSLFGVVLLYRHQLQRAAAHGAPEQQSLSDDILGMYEVADAEAQKTILSIVQVSTHKWALQQQTAVPKASVDGQTFLVLRDSLFEKSEDKWAFQQKCFFSGAYYLCENLETTYIFDLKGRFLDAAKLSAEPIKLQVRSKDKVYYFNIIEGGVSLYALEPTKMGLRLCYLSNLTKETKSDLRKLPFKVNVKLHPLGKRNAGHHPNSQSKRTRNWQNSCRTAVFTSTTT